MSQQSQSQQNHRKINLRYSSCSECRKAKKKCDQKLPRCSLCVKKDKECSYLAQDQRKAVTKDYANALLHRVSKLEEALQFYKDENEKLKGEKSQNSSYASFEPDLLQLDSPVTNDQDAINNRLRMNLFTKDSASDDQNTKRSYPFLDSMGITLSNATLKYCSDYSLRLKAPLFDNWGFSFMGGGAPLFFGYTSMRYRHINAIQKPIDNTTESLVTKKLLRESYGGETLGSFYQEIFEWFFEIMNNSIPLVNEDLFLGSIERSLDQEALEIEEDQHALIALINSMMAYYFAYHDGYGANFEYFYNLAHQQVNEETKYRPQLECVQTLLLLSLIDMNRGNEIKSSESVAKAVALSYHLGLHINSQGLSSQNVLSDSEALQRDLVFWCCFIIDKLRGSILGISPYIHCPDLSIRLPSPTQFSSVDEKVKINVLRETISFADTQCETLNQFAAALRDIFFAQEKDENKEYVKIGLAVSKAALSMSEWKKDLVFEARYSNTRTISAAYIEVLYHTSMIILHKQLVKEPLTREEILPEAQTPIAICTRSAENILKICEARKHYSVSFFEFHFAYSVYMAAVIFLFNTSAESENIRAIQRSYFQKAIYLLESSRVKVPVAETYLSCLEKFHDQWLQPDHNSAVL
ncbi:hypothetical protein DASC09_008750 [Saccharomycopsis crataegensis]|uniref:Zn(2)-C6 fungal-type domain-containing protein n=1 Tax=Saccharomycopsis crataegensis TaxID=43959 RepID=A0AAV5QF21_9ASCO|nr:hypothetical protein DASC09_008750 [Saccharomycopsis crataegensis]